MVSGELQAALDRLKNDTEWQKAEAKEKEAKAELQARISRRSKHDRERINELQANPNKLYYSLQTAGAGLFIQFESLFDLRVLVSNTPEYKAIENIIDKVILNGLPKYSMKQSRPYSLLFEDCETGEKVREKVYKAYQCAIGIYKYCAENKITIFEFAEKYNPEFGTLFDYELEKFFQL